LILTDDHEVCDQQIRKLRQVVMDGIALLDGGPHINHVEYPKNHTTAREWLIDARAALAVTEVVAPEPHPEGWVNPLSNFGDDENDRMPWQQEEAGQDPIP
jgi:hypothetical protein